MAKNVTRVSPETGSSPAVNSDRPLAVLRTEVDRLFDSFFPPAFGRPGLDCDRWCDRAFGELTSRVDVKEYGDHYEIAAELPGLDEKDVDVTVADGVLSIAGEKRAEAKVDNTPVPGRSFGTFAFRLPDDADPDTIGAEFAKGVLTLTVPRHGEGGEQERKIDTTGH